MAAPTASDGNSNAVSTATLNHTMPAVIAAGDIIVIVVGHATTATAATAITASNAASQAFTKLFDITIKNSAGTSRGRVAVFTKVADGSEDSVTAQFTHDGTSGTSSCFFGNSTLVLGAEASATPHASASNNPNYAEGTITPHPAATSTVADCLSLLLFFNGDNFNITTPTNWVSLSSDANGTGSDAAHDSDTRTLASAGTYTPGSVTLSTTSVDIGWAGFHLIFAPPAAGGPTTLEPGLTTHTRQVYAAKANPTLLASLITHARAIFSPELDETLLPALLTHTRALYGAVVVPTLKPGLLTHAQAVYSPTVSAPGATLLAGLSVHTRAIYSPRTNASIIPTRIEHARAVYAAAAVSLHTLSPGLIAHARAIYSPSIGTLTALSPARIDHARAIYAPRVAPQLRMGLIVHGRLVLSPLVDDGTGLPPSVFASRHYNHGRHER